MNRRPFVETAFGACVLVMLAGIVFKTPGLTGLGGPLEGGAELRFPFVYDLLAPFTAGADRLTLLSVAQWKVLAAWAAALFAAFRALARLGPDKRKGWAVELRWAAAALALAVAVLAWTAWWGRPMAALTLSDPDWLSVDFHSHSSRSWDGRKGFTPLANAEWHRRAGFDAGFITDHGTAEGGLEGAALSLADYKSLAGSEVSVEGLHLVALGCGKRIEAKSIAEAVSKIHACEGAAVASLPEYRERWWGDGLEKLAGWGVDGFEVLNGAPKASGFAPSEREVVFELCRRRKLAFTSLTDTHGWGSAPLGWSLVKLPGWRALDRAALEAALVRKLRRDGPDAVRIAARTRLEPESPLALAFDPPRQLFLTLRTMTRLQRAFTLGWLGAFLLLPGTGLLRRVK